MQTTYYFAYDDVKQFAITWCKLQQQLKGNAFATQPELDSILCDVFAWLNMWLYAFCDSLGLVVVDVGVNHYKRTFTLLGYPKA